MPTLRPVQPEPQQETLEHPGKDDDMVVTVKDEEDDELFREAYDYATNWDEVAEEENVEDDAEEEPER